MITGVQMRKRNFVEEISVSTVLKGNLKHY